MFAEFEKYLSNKSDLSLTEIERIFSMAVKKKIKRKQFLVHEGDTTRHKAFVISGLLRTYRINDNGDEHIIRFSPENWWSTDLQSYNNETPSKYNVDALEDSEVLLWSKDNFEELSKKLPGLKAFSERLIYKSFDASQNRIYSNISNTAEQKYNEFLNSSPNIINRVPLHMVASFLGVTRETLSRIKNQHPAR